MQIKSNDKSMQLIMIIASSLIIILLIVLCVTRFMHIKETVSEIDSYEQIVQSNHTKLAQLMEMSKREDEFKKAIEKMNKLLPDEAQENVVINQIQKASEKNSSDFVRIEFAQRVVSNNINTMPITLKFSGQYTSLMAIVKEVTRGERLIIFDEFVINQLLDKAGLVDAEIRGRAFFR